MTLCLPPDSLLIWVQVDEVRPGLCHFARKMPLSAGTMGQVETGQEELTGKAGTLSLSLSLSLSVCVCVMGQVVGMDEQTVRWSSLTGSVSLCSEMILRMSC